MHPHVIYAFVIWDISNQHNDAASYSFFLLFRPYTYILQLRFYQIKYHSKPLKLTFILFSHSQINHKLYSEINLPFTRWFITFLSYWKIASPKSDLSYHLALKQSILKLKWLPPIRTYCLCFQWDYSLCSFSFP